MFMRELTLSGNIGKLILLFAQLMAELIVNPVPSIAAITTLLFFKFQPLLESTFVAYTVKFELKVFVFSIFNYDLKKC